MTPKEKASRLVDDMYLEMFDFSVTDEVLLCVAKEQALICCDEIINSNPVKVNSYDYGECNILYWNEVKKQINKL